MTTFWEWQHRVLGVLLGWGVGSTVVGAGLATAKNEVVRHVGLQAVGWGLIDAIIALLGRNGARQKVLSQTHQQEQLREAQRFQTIVAINAGLDVLYVLGGRWLVQHAGMDAARRGAGIGIMVQGAFLLVYDIGLVWLVRRA